MYTQNISSNAAVSVVQLFSFQEHFTLVFCQHYQKIAKAIVTTSGTREVVEQLSNRVVHISVQLFSNKQLAEKMVREQNLLHVMVKVLHDMIRPTLVPYKMEGKSLEDEGMKWGR